MYTFLRYWRSWLVEHGHQITDAMGDDYDLLFVNSFMVSPSDIRQVRRERPDVPIIQRVDGSAWDYGRFDNADELQARANLYADMTIFQSEYSRYSTMEKYRVISQNGPVIYNPVDPDIFTPHGNTVDLPGTIRVCNVSWSTNRRKGTWQIGMLAEARPDVDFILCGNYPELPDLANIHQLVHLEHDDLAAVLRSCHIYTHLAQNDPCPNVILEGLASGLPVLYIDSGGSPELVGSCGSPCTVETFSDALDAVMGRHAELSAAARQRVETHFTPTIVFPRYTQALQEARPRSAPTLPHVLALVLRGYPVAKENALLAKVRRAVHRLRSN
ncbi:MAG: glycosyltransferase family 4 protein [Anaerolineae bacterium]